MTVDGCDGAVSSHVRGRPLGRRKSKRRRKSIEPGRWRERKSIEPGRWRERKSIEPGRWPERKSIEPGRWPERKSSPAMSEAVRNLVAASRGCISWPRVFASWIHFDHTYFDPAPGSTFSTRRLYSWVLTLYSVMCLSPLKGTRRRHGRKEGGTHTSTTARGTMTAKRERPPRPLEYGFMGASY